MKHSAANLKANPPEKKSTVYRIISLFVQYKLWRATITASDQFVVPMSYCFFQFFRATSIDRLFTFFYLTRGNFTIFYENPNSWMKAKLKKIINETFVICVRSKANSSLVSCCIPPSYKKRNKYARNLCFIMFLKQSNLDQVLLISLAQAVAISVLKVFLIGRG